MATPRKKKVTKMRTGKPGRPKTKFSAAVGVELFGVRAMKILAGELAAEQIDPNSLTIEEADAKLAQIEREKRERLRIYRP